MSLQNFVGNIRWEILEAAHVAAYRHCFHLLRFSHFLDADLRPQAEAQRN